MASNTRPPRHELRVLVTGFGSFPGMPRNPTLRILDGMERQKARLSRQGIALHTRALAVRYAGLDAALRAAAAEIQPDLIILLGVAGRRRRISVETRALNFANPLRVDAGRAAPSRHLRIGGPGVLKATWPAARVCAAVRAAGFAADLSRDAGGYVCNAALYHALREELAPCIGFLHVPGRRGRAAINLEAAVLATIRAARLRLLANSQQIICA